MRVRKFQKEAKQTSKSTSGTNTPQSSSISNNSPKVSNRGQMTGPMMTEYNSSRHSSRPISPTLSQQSGPFTTNDEDRDRSLIKRSPIADQSEIVFENSNEAVASKLNTDNGFVGESTPLLTMNKNNILPDMPTADFKFGTLTANTGLWHKDVSGKNLIRFVVLLLLLVFSSFVVSLSELVVHGGH